MNIFILNINVTQTQTNNEFGVFNPPRAENAEASDAESSELSADEETKLSDGQSHASSDLESAESSDAESSELSGDEETKLSDGRSHASSDLESAESSDVEATVSTNTDSTDVESLRSVWYNRSPEVPEEAAELPYSPDIGYPRYTDVPAESQSPSCDSRYSAGGTSPNYGYSNLQHPESPEAAMELPYSPDIGYPQYTDVPAESPTSYYDSRYYAGSTSPNYGDRREWQSSSTGSESRYADSSHSRSLYSDSRYGNWRYSGSRYSGPCYDDSWDPRHPHSSSRNSDSRYSSSLYSDRPHGELRYDNIPDVESSDEESD